MESLTTDQPPKASLYLDTPDIMNLPVLNAAPVCLKQDILVIIIGYPMKNMS